MAQTSSDPVRGRRRELGSPSALYPAGAGASPDAREQEPLVIDDDDLACQVLLRRALAGVLVVATVKMLVR